MALPIQKPGATDELVSQFELVGRPQLRLDEVVVPVHVLHDHLYAAAGGYVVAVAGGVGNRSLAMISNTLDGERPVRVTRALVQCSAANYVFVGRPTAAIAGTTQTTLTMRDFRYGAPTCVLTGRNNAAAPALTTFMDVEAPGPGTAFLEIPLDVTLGGGPPGFGPDIRSLVIMPVIDNVGITVNFQWEESQRREPIR